MLLASKGHFLILLMIPTWIFFPEIVFSRLWLWIPADREWITTRAAPEGARLILGKLTHLHIHWASVCWHCFGSHAVWPPEVQRHGSCLYPQDNGRLPRTVRPAHKQDRSVGKCMHWWRCGKTLWEHSGFTKVALFIERNETDAGWSQWKILGYLLEIKEELDHQAHRAEWLWGTQQREFKNSSSGTSLVVQWLRLCLPMQGVQDQSLVGSLDPTCLATKKPKHKTEAIFITQSIKT